jgi:hypothetical protein
MLSRAMLDPSRSLGLCLVTLVVSACGSDLFHSTDWDTLCDKNPAAAGCPGPHNDGAGGGGGGDAGDGAASSSGGNEGPCRPCVEVASASTQMPSLDAVCPSSRDIYSLLNECRCTKMSGSCSAACSLSPACGGASIAVVSDCEICMQKQCGTLLEACGMLSGP